MNSVSLNSWKIIHNCKYNFLHHTDIFISAFCYVFVFMSFVWISKKAINILLNNCNKWKQKKCIFWDKNSFIEIMLI
jgi:hypothetical protein